MKAATNDYLKWAGEAVSHVPRLLDTHEGGPGDDSAEWTDMCGDVRLMGV